MRMTEPEPEVVRPYLALSAHSQDSPGYHPAPTFGESPTPGGNNYPGTALDP